MQKKLKEIKPGEVFTYAEYQWIKLKEKGLCLMVDILEEKRFDKNSNNWMKSELREYLNTYIFEDLITLGANKMDFLSFETNLVADDGLKDYGKTLDYVGLLTAELYRGNRYLLTPIDACWWLSTPQSCKSNRTDCVLIVDNEGLVCDVFVNYGETCIRPLISLQSDALVEFPSGGDNLMENTDITGLIKKWAIDRNLTSGDPKSQMVKLLEEAGKLATGVNKNKQDLIVDSIGDVYVVLVILCMQLGLDINDCIKSAYNEIKDRKGKMINGTFVKEEDLEV